MNGDVNMIQVGQLAPDFTLEGLREGEFIDVSLSDYRGKWVVLFFWPLDFTFICPTEILEFSRRIEEFEKLNAVVLGASTDSKYTHLAWTEKIGDINFPMLSDLTKQVSRDYGILIEGQGIALRGTFIIDPQGKIQYQAVHNLNVGRSVDEILRVLSALQTGELCPVEWEPGKATLGS
ncbi:MAG TPA: peroxiredoxin, partial [Armatimonadota bacterium]|nr:peroxiredoxin [Armatimonadota bacterium]